MPIASLGKIDSCSFLLPSQHRQGRRIGPASHTLQSEMGGGTSSGGGGLQGPGPAGCFFFKEPAFPNDPTTKPYVCRVPGRWKGGREAAVPARMGLKEPHRCSLVWEAGGDPGLHRSPSPPFPPSPPSPPTPNPSTVPRESMRSLPAELGLITSLTSKHKDVIITH